MVPMPHTRPRPTSLLQVGDQGGVDQPQRVQPPQRLWVLPPRGAPQGAGTQYPCSHVHRDDESVDPADQPLEHLRVRICISPRPCRSFRRTPEFIPEAERTPADGYFTRWWLFTLDEPSVSPAIFTSTTRTSTLPTTKPVIDSTASFTCRCTPTATSGT